MQRFRSVLPYLFAFAPLASFAGCGPEATTGPTTPPTATTTTDTTPSSTASAKPPASSSTAAKPDGIKTLFINEARVDCHGEAPRKCMQVREAESEPWTRFYASIEGFTYEESYKYELKVSVESVGNPAADSSSKKYKLVEVVSKQKVASK